MQLVSSATLRLHDPVEQLFAGPNSSWPLPGGTADPLRANGICHKVYNPEIGHCDMITSQPIPSWGEQNIWGQTGATSSDDLLVRVS